MLNLFYFIFKPKNFSSSIFFTVPQLLSNQNRVNQTAHCPRVAGSRQRQLEEITHCLVGGEENTRDYSFRMGCASANFGFLFQ
jgi:hypothetical protein